MREKAKLLSKRTCTKDLAGGHHMKTTEHAEHTPCGWSSSSVESFSPPISESYDSFRRFWPTPKPAILNKAQLGSWAYTATVAYLSGFHF